MKKKSVSLMTILRFHDDKITQVPAIWDVAQKGYNSHRAGLLFELFVEKTNITVIDCGRNFKGKSTKRFNDLVATVQANYPAYQNFIETERKAIRKIK